MGAVTRVLGVTLLLWASAAGAVKKGEPLFVRSKDTKVLEKADVKAKALTTLQPGAQVTWLGADATNRQLHHVEFTDPQKKTVSGFVLQANLSPNAPTAEISATDGKPIDAQAFKSSGAATKALGGMALEYANSKKLTGLPEKLIALENISQSVDPKALDERARALGLAVRDAAPPPAAPAAPKKGKGK